MGCRCQAYMLTGDARNADPVCAKSPHHADLVNEVEQISADADAVPETPLVFRNMKNSKELSAG